MLMSFFLGVSAILTSILAVFSFRFNRAFRRFQLTKTRDYMHDLPSVTVCIPARNEIHAMSQCLERVLDSDYKKLEVVVYDDHSKDDTSVLIRSFAHEGVRFIPGSHLPEGWLGRNHALEVLANEASGSFIVFIDVDTIIEPTTISQLMKYVKVEKLAMASVMPIRQDTWRSSVLFGPLRYFWELLVANATVPASSGALWTIERSVLKDELGGIGPFKANVRMEAAMAAQLGAHRYKCVISSPELGVSFEKKWSSQVETSTRLLYPLSGATDLKAVLAILVLVLLNLPSITLLSSVITGWSIEHAMALWLLTAFMAVYAMYATKLWRNRWWLAGLLWPYVIAQELVLYIRSYIGYKKGTITWKGRLVTAPPLNTDLITLDK